MKRLPNFMSDHNYQPDTVFYNGDEHQPKPADRPQVLPRVDKSRRLDLHFQLDCHKLHARIQRSNFPQQFVRPLETLFLYLFPGALSGSQYLVDIGEFEKIAYAYKYLKQMPIDMLDNCDRETLESLKASVTKKIIQTEKAIGGFLEG